MIDSWAILAIVFQKPGAERIAAASPAWAFRRMSTVDWHETLMPSPAAALQWRRFLPDRSAVRNGEIVRE
jgi:hypothetical protein